MRFGSLLAGLACALSCAPAPADPGQTSPAWFGRPVARGTVFGSADPFVLVAADPGRRWVALCQADRDTDRNGVTHTGFLIHGNHDGDRMSLRLVTGDGHPERLDGWVGATSDGRYALVDVHGEFQLRDFATGSVTSLAALAPDGVRDDAPGLVPRTAAFSPDGRKLALIGVLATGRTAVLVLDLATRELRYLPHGDGRLWRLQWARSSTWLMVHVVVRDSDGDGSFELPRYLTTASPGDCGSPGSYSTLGFAGPDDFETRVVPVEAGAVRTRPGLIAFLRNRAVWRAQDRSIAVEDAGGNIERIIPAACDARVVHVNAQHDAVIAACGLGPDDGLREPELRPGDYYLLWQDGKSQRLPLQPEPHVRETQRAEFDRFAQIVAGDGATRLVDVLTGEMLRVRPRGHTCGHRYPHALMTHRDDVWLYDMERERRRRVDAYGCVPGRASAGQFQFLGNNLFDWARGRVVPGTVDYCAGECVEAVSRDGRVLVAEPPPLTREQRTARSLRALLTRSRRVHHTAKLGPLRWVARLPEPDEPTPKPDHREESGQCRLPHLSAVAEAAPVPPYFERGALPLRRWPRFSSDDAGRAYPPFEHVRARYCSGDAAMRERVHAAIRAGADNAYRRMIEGCVGAGDPRAEVFSRRGLRAISLGGLFQHTRLLESAERALHVLSDLPGSPITGAVVDTPERLDSNGVMRGAWSIYLDDTRYRTSPETIAHAASHAFPSANLAEDASFVMAWGLAAFLNDVAERREHDMRFTISWGPLPELLSGTRSELCAAIGDRKLRRPSPRPWQD